MADTNLVENFKVDLICPVCLDYFTDPVIANCGHTFCRKCLFRDSKRAHRPKTCPLCRARIKLGEDLRSNKGLENVVSTGRMLRPYLLQSIKGLTTCDQHGKEESLFCEEDHRPLCESCLSSTEHKEHRVLPLEKAAELYMEKLQEVWNILREKQEEFQLKLDHEKDREVHCEENSQISKVLVLCEYEDMHYILMEEEQLHLQRLEQETREKLAKAKKRYQGRHSLEMSTEEVGKNVERSPKERMKKFQKIWKNLRRKKALQAELACERKKNLAMKQEVMSEYQKKHRTLSEEEQLYVKRVDQDVRDNLAKFEKSRARLSQHIHNLQMMVSEAQENFEKPLLELLQDGKGTLQRTEDLLLQDPGVASLTWTKFPMPAMTEMLMTFHRDVTLDPETANSHLILSDDLKSIRYVRASGDLPDDLKSLECSMTVLATQSFSSGKHYWEVEVGDKIPWEVGICNKSTNKEKEEGKTPWIVCNSIGSQSGSDFSLDNSHCLQDSHKVGIFLDFERRYITFYNCTDKTFLCRIPQLDFDGAVYPCFSPVLLNTEITHGHLTICPRTEQ